MSIKIMEEMESDITVRQLADMVTKGGSAFFDKETMSFFGDTFSNYGITKLICFEEDKQIEVYKLFRKKPVKHGLFNPAYFTYVKKYPFVAGYMKKINLE